MNTEQIFQKIRLKENEDLEHIISKVDINLLNEDKQSFLHEAVVYNNIEAIRMLLKKGIDVNLPDKNNQTALHYIPLYNDENKLEKARLILEAGADLNIRDKFGNTPLWTATFNARGNYNLVELYLKFNPDKNNKNNANRTPLDFALQIKDEHLIKVLS